ncbi:MAG: hypothetical protein KTR14_10815 [Vampirovibrio sp.]|nr:hypothetical protein [Vampirovibrio sp.]
MSEENTAHHNRWYDDDPALTRALEQLRMAPDKYQAQVALNIIKIIIEHKQEDGETTELTEVRERMEASLQNPQPFQSRRWYDLNEALRSAIDLIQDCPDDLQQNVVPTVSRMIEETLKQGLDSSTSP